MTISLLLIIATSVAVFLQKQNCFGEIKWKSFTSSASILCTRHSVIFSKILNSYTGRKLLRWCFDPPFCITVTRAILSSPGKSPLRRMQLYAWASGSARIGGMNLFGSGLISSGPGALLVFKESIMCKFSHSSLALRKIVQCVRVCVQLIAFKTGLSLVSSIPQHQKCLLNLWHSSTSSSFSRRIFNWERQVKSSVIFVTSLSTFLNFLRLICAQKFTAIIVMFIFP